MHFKATQALCHFCTVVQCSYIEFGTALQSSEGEMELLCLDVLLEHES